MTKEERLDWIDNATYYSLLSLTRFELPGSPWFTDKDVSRHLFARRAELQEVDPAGAAQDSRELGWDR